MKPSSVLFQFKIIIIKSANKDLLFTSPTNWFIPFFYPYMGMDNQILKTNMPWNKLVDS